MWLSFVALKQLGAERDIWSMLLNKPLDLESVAGYKGPQETDHFRNCSYPMGSNVFHMVQQRTAQRSFNKKPIDHMMIKRTTHNISQHQNVLDVIIKKQTGKKYLAVFVTHYWHCFHSVNNAWFTTG